MGFSKIGKLQKYAEAFLEDFKKVIDWDIKMNYPNPNLYINHELKRLAKEKDEALSFNVDVWSSDINYGSGNDGVHILNQANVYFEMNQQEFMKSINSPDPNDDFEPDDFEEFNEINSNEEIDFDNWFNGSETGFTQHEIFLLELKRLLMVPNSGTKEVYFSSWEISAFAIHFLWKEELDNLFLKTKSETGSFFERTMKRHGEEVVQKLIVELF